MPVLQLLAEVAQAKTTWGQNTRAKQEATVPRGARQPHDKHTPHSSYHHHKKQECREASRRRHLYESSKQSYIVILILGGPQPRASGRLFRDVNLLLRTLTSHLHSQFANS